MIRRFRPSGIFWLGLLGLAFLGWSWVGSMNATRGVSWRWGNRAVFLAISDGSIRPGYQGRSGRDEGFVQWSIPRGQYTNRSGDHGWFASPVVNRDPERQGWMIAVPHWLLVALWVLGVAAGWQIRKNRLEISEM